MECLIGAFLTILQFYSQNDTKRQGEEMSCPKPETPLFLNMNHTYSESQQQHQTINKLLLLLLTAI
jgi:hypothetical protein